MRKNLILLTLAFTSFLANCDVLNSTTPNQRDSKHVTRLKQTPNNDGSTASVNNRHRHKHRKSRCRRDLSRGFIGTYQRNVKGDWVYVEPNNYGPSAYRLPHPVYVPTRCNNYCPYCPVSSCRRRCPPSFIRPTIRPPTRPTSRTIVCNCDPDGSKFQMCNVNTGSCVCNPHYTGHHCDTCVDGSWKNNRKCEECKCNEQGTEKNTNCNKQTGKCHCRPGVTGTRCDTCLPDHYGTIEMGCKRCDPCHKEGHICDPQNGKCVCPPLTTGVACGNCSANSYGYEPGIGCKACNCSESGSANLQCDHIGQCTCAPGYEGEKCNRCKYGFYGYPNCRRCNCLLEGTEDQECKNGDCRCDDKGACKCKENVRGKDCDRCKENYYGLTKENPKGCTGCFCFGRSDQCEDAQYHWNKTRLDRTNRDNDQIDQDVLELPREFLGDLTSSYRGYLTVQVREGKFDVYLRGNGVSLNSTDNRNYLQMVESSKWRISSGNPYFPNNCIDNLTRPCFMVVMEKVTSIQVRARNRIKEVLLDRAEDKESHAITHSIEKCKCPQKYSGLSCQNPNEGYYRYFPDDRNSNWIDPIIGIAKRCECGGHSEECDPETGICKNCTDHTTGDHCEYCDVGFYLDKQNTCAACLCPSADQNNAKSCTPTKDGFTCQCKNGYRGKYCNECEVNYFKAPSSQICQPCGCNQYGIEDTGSCNQDGKCRCKNGFKGTKCDQCVEERKYIESGVCKACDECTMKLFNEIDKMSELIEGIFDSFKIGIGPPWKKLTEDIGKLDGLSEKFYNEKEKIETLLEKANIDDYEKKVSEMEIQLDENNKLAEDTIDRTDAIHKNSTTLLEETEEQSKKLIKIIKSLGNFGNKQVNLKEALKRAELILKEIRYESKKLTQLDVDVFAQCEAVNRRVESIYKPVHDSSDDKLKELKKKLQDLINIVSSVDNLAKLADSKNTENSRRIEKVKEKIEILKSKNNSTQTSLVHIAEKTEAVEEILQQLGIVYKDLKNISEFDEFTELENRVKRQMDDIPKIEQLYSQAIEHVQELENKINKYHNLFNFTKDEWKRINASGAYESIISGIKQARESIKESEKILKKAIEIISPEDSDNLDARTNLAHAYSDRLKQRINNLKNISKNLMDIKNKLDDLKYNILEKGKSNNNLAQILLKIDRDISLFGNGELEEAKRNATRISEAMRKIEKQLEDMNFDQQFFLEKNYEKYRAEMAPEEKKYFDKKLKEVRAIVKGLSILPPSTNDNKTQQGNKLKNLEINITNLHNKIKEAKQQVDVIDVAMNLSNCKMTYKLSKPEYFQSLSIIFRCENCVLFNWIQPSSSKLTLSVENYKPILRVERKEISLENDSKNERTIKLQKIGSLLKLQMGDEEKSTIVENMVKIGGNDTLEVGSRNKPASNAHVYKIVLNEKNFGLWKFETTNGYCKGVKRNSTALGNKTYNLYNGEGYSKYKMDNKPNEISLKFKIETFDENSTIYVAEYKDIKRNKYSFIYLYLLHGKAHLSMRHENGQTFAINSCKFKVNDARTHVLELSLFYNSGQQFYGLKVDQKSCSESGNKALDKKNVFKFKLSKHYIGGVPPTFNRTIIPVTTHSFLGLLDLTNLIGSDEISHGIIKTSKNVLEFNNAWINTNGYLKIETPKQQLKTLNFVLRPITDGIIMKFDDDQYISLENGKLVINDMKHKHQLRIDDYNNIELRLENVPKRAIVDGEDMSLEGLKELSVNHIQIGDHNNGFSGGIRDIIINDKLITFNADSVKNFTNVEIGREKPLVESTISVRSLTMMNFTNSMQNTEGCVDFDSYNTEADAVKYGDKPNSYTHMRTNFWKNNYTLQFDFRTLSPNGILFITSNKKMKYILLGLRKGRLYLTVKRGKKETKPLPISSYIVNDGLWHNLKITKKLKKLFVILDGEQSRGIHFRIKPKDEIYFGGVPSNSAYTMVGDLFDKLQPFRGCIRNLSINDERKLLIKNSKEIEHSGITQCFSNVEEGAYFGGDAYAIYKNDFRVRESVKLSFEFRTSEQNGVLLSISNEDDSPALSVELQNGAIVMAVDNGNGIVSNVTNNLDSDFSLCNNRWHNVTALYSSSEITVNVDGIRKSWVVSDYNSTIDELKASLYIGGIPDTAPTGTLKSLTNFKGCLRKLTIENQLIDWSSMKNFNNVLLNSCPVNQDS